MVTYEELMNEKEAPVIFADGAGIITDVNDLFLKTFGWDRAELEGQLLTKIMPEKFHDAHAMGVSRFMSTKTRTLPEHALELEVLKGDGTTCTSEHTIVTAEVDGQWRLAGKIVPIDSQ